MIHIIHRYLRRWLWSSNVTATQWPITTSCIPLTYAHRHLTQMEYPQTRSLWGILCHIQIELLSRGSDIIMCNDHKPLQKFLNEKNANNKLNQWSLELATYNKPFKWIFCTQNKMMQQLPASLSTQLQHHQLTDPPLAPTAKPKQH